MAAGEARGDARGHRATGGRGGGHDCLGGCGSRGRARAVGEGTTTGGGPGHRGEGASCRGHGASVGRARGEGRGRGAAGEGACNTPSNPWTDGTYSWQLARIIYCPHRPTRVFCAHFVLTHAHPRKLPGWSPIPNCSKPRTLNLEVLSR
jgi:hypothetical protein